jgi:hypothetical protein
MMKRGERGSGAPSLRISLEKLMEKIYLPPDFRFGDGEIEENLCPRLP